MEYEIEVGKYILKKKLSKGDTVDTFLGFHKKNSELVFVKRFIKGNMNNEDKKKLNNEIRILKNLNSPNIISLKDFAKSQNHYYIILEYCNGGNLSKYIKDYIQENKKPLNEFLIQKIIKQITSAIEYIFSKKLVNRNIKLENMLLNFDSHINIAQNRNLPSELTFEEKSLNKIFTIKLTGLDRSEEFKKVRDNRVMIGNPDKMADNLDAGDPSDDLWSLGLITYELLTGSPPIIGHTSEELYKSIQEGKYNLPDNLKCSIEIISFINGLLEINTEKRLNLEQIKSHPFLNISPEYFKYIDLVKLSETEKEQIKINSNDNDNLLGKLFKCKDLDLNIDKINQKEIQKPDVKEKIRKTLVVNKDIEKASEEEKIEKKKEIEKFENMKIKAEEKIKKTKTILQNQIEKPTSTNEEKNKKGDDEDETLDADESTEIALNEQQKILEIINQNKINQEKIENENRKLKEEIERYKRNMETKGNETNETNQNTIEKPKGETPKETNGNTEKNNIDDEKNEDDIIIDSDDVEFEDFTYNGYEIDNNYLEEKFSKI